jgi:hypothetical protein
LLNGQKRWCLWLKNTNPNELKLFPSILNRIQIVKNHRIGSSRAATVELAQTPTLFGFISQPESNYILIPRHSSENRSYIPFGFFSENFIVADSCYCCPDTGVFHFGILMSKMHNVWIKSICGRIKSDYRYSNTIVYNNYPWPESPTDKQKEAIEKAAQKVLDARAAFPNTSLADLYDPLTMPPILVKAHNELDKAVDLAYRPQAFTSDANRMEFLFELYEKYTAGLFAVEKKKKGKLIRRD